MQLGFESQISKEATFRHSTAYFTTLVNTVYVATCTGAIAEDKIL